METKYKVNDVVYYINDFRVIKMIVNEIVTRKTFNAIHVTYTISPYKKDVKAKPISCIEAYLVADLETAKKSALANWDRITKQVYKDINNLTDEMYEPDPQKDKDD